MEPRFIFFPHWSWIVPKDIIEYTECVCFHASDLPYGKGGSPIQNLIIRGIKKTKLSAIKMTEKLDSGPIYIKYSLNLHGKAQAIYSEMSHLTWKMIKKIVEKKIKPKSQIGKSIEFKRRKPKQSEISSKVTIDKLFDHIRMLDAETYPKAFLHYGNLRLEFHNAKLKSKVLEAKVKITKK